MQNILREESENNINYKPDYTIKSHKAELINNQNQNLINTHRSTLSNYSQTDLENKIRMIAVKLKEEVELDKKKMKFIIIIYYKKKMILFLILKKNYKLFN